MKLLLSIAAGVLGYCYYRGAAERRTRSHVKDELRRWEGEGGYVPTVATPTPSPYPPTNPSTFAGDPGIRH